MPAMMAIEDLGQIGRLLVEEFRQTEVCSVVGLAIA